ncbi:uncharacterized protein LOC144132746 isoform X4 [Amblyomma americanum]
MGRSAEKDLRRANTGSGELQDDDAVRLLCAQDAACWACIACLGVLFLNGRAKRLTSTVVPYVGGMFFAEISQLTRGHTTTHWNGGEGTTSSSASPVYATPCHLYKARSRHHGRVVMALGCWPERRGFDPGRGGRISMQAKF